MFIPLESVPENASFSYLGKVYTKLILSWNTSAYEGKYLGTQGKDLPLTQIQDEDRNATWMTNCTKVTYKA